MYILRWTLGLGENVKTFLPFLKCRALRDNTSNAVQSSPLMVMLFTRLLFILYGEAIKHCCYGYLDRLLCTDFTTTVQNKLPFGSQIK